MIYLPLTTPETEQVEYKQSQIKSIQGTTHILLVEDEEMVRDVASQMLKQIGCTVSVCADGEEAVDFYRKHWQEIDLVILDLVMPKMDGEEAFFAMREINSHIIVLLSSGYSIDGKASRIIEKGAKGFIKKPFRKGELLKRISEIAEMQRAQA
jgi:CheY-like chemotaxis protein